MPKLQHKTSKVVISVADDHPLVGHYDYEPVSAPAKKAAASKKAEPAKSGAADSDD